MNMFRIAFRFTFLSMLLFGVLYPLAMTETARLIAPDSAKGRPVYRDGTLVGFKNIGQLFTGPDYFWGRPSAAGYNAAASGGSNLSASNPEFADEVENRVDSLLKYHPGLTRQAIPPDLLTASASGLDPHISLEAALIQTPRIARNRGVKEEDLETLVRDHEEGPLLGIFGPGGLVNVLELNLALDEFSKKTGPESRISSQPEADGSGSY